MRLTGLLWLTLWANALACRPTSDLDATRRGSPSVAATSESESSEPAVVTPPTTHAPTPTSTGAPQGPTPAPSSTPASASSLAATSSGLEPEAETSSGASEHPTLELTSAIAVETSDAASGSTSEPSFAPTTDEAPETTSPPATCSSKCGMGETCSAISDCLSLRCDGVCQPMEMTVESDGIDAISTSVKMHVRLYGDPAVAVAWKDLAVLYFFTVEQHDDFKLNFAQGGGSAIAMQATLKDWLLVWTTDAAGNVAANGTEFDVQLHSYPWLPDVPESNDNSNDYSYRAEHGPNDKIVLCRRVDGEWRHAQGIAPAHITDPCQYVGNCDAALSCDPLEPSPP